MDHVKTQFEPALYTVGQSYGRRLKNKDTHGNYTMHFAMLLAAGVY